MRRGKGLYLGAFCCSERRYGGIALKQNGSRRRFLVLIVVLNATEGRHTLPVDSGATRKDRSKRETDIMDLVCDDYQTTG